MACASVELWMGIFSRGVVTTRAAAGCGMAGSKSDGMRRHARLRARLGLLRLGRKVGVPNSKGAAHLFGPRFGPGGSVDREPGPPRGAICARSYVYSGYPPLSPLGIEAPVSRYRLPVRAVRGLPLRSGVRGGGRRPPRLAAEGFDFPLCALYCINRITHSHIKFNALCALYRVPYGQSMQQAVRQSTPSTRAS